MNFLPQNLLSLSASVILAAFSIGSAFGQAVKVEGGKPKFEDITSPEFASGKQKNFKPKEWLEIETGLKVALSPAPATKVCEKLTVKWYVAVRSPEKASAMLLLTKDVDYINVPLEEEIFFSVYLSPGSVKLLTGSDRAAQSSVEAVGYEVLVNGVKVAEETSKFKPGWWNASKNISRNDSVPLLKKPETPFAHMWWDRYAEVAVERR